MNKTVAKRKVLPTVVVALFIIVMMGLAFLPAIRRGGDSVAFGGTDGGAVEMLDKCAEYADKHGFTARLNGTVKARVFGVPYTLNVSGERSALGDDFDEVKESASSLVKIGLKASCSNGEYRVAHGEYDGKIKRFTYDDGEAVSREEYEAAYGVPHTRLIKYVTDGNILSAECRDENTFVYTLDVGAAACGANEVKTILNSKKLPEYKSIELTLITDGERAVKITAVEKFRADKFGGVDCTATYTEVFSYK